MNITSLESMNCMKEYELTYVLIFLKLKKHVYNMNETQFFFFFTGAQTQKYVVY